MSQLLFLIQSADVAPASAAFWVPAIAAGALAAIVLAAYHQLKKPPPGCGSEGCIDGGEIFLFREAEEAQRLEAMRLEAMRLEATRLEAMRLEAMRLEAMRLEAMR